MGTFAYYNTLQKKEVYTWWKYLAKCFKICYIFEIRKPTYKSKNRANFCSVSLSHFIKHKHLISEECIQLLRFSYFKNIANFELFRLVISSSINLLFLKSGLLTITIITFLLARYKLRVWFNFWTGFKQYTHLAYEIAEWKPATTISGFT